MKRSGRSFKAGPLEAEPEAGVWCLGGIEGGLLEETEIGNEKMLSRNLFRWNASFSGVVLP